MKFLIFSTASGKIIKPQIWWKSVQWKPSCSSRWTDRHAYGRKDRQKERHEDRQQ